MNPAVEQKPETYQRSGISLDPFANLMLVDLNQPRRIMILGVNEVTGERRNYTLSVTRFGRLLLQ